eukprot:m.257674 g.257674  ORF g.257674 m.257674 type:complete len:856 (+) comp15532_c0_seq2:50-2617(+)
MAEANPSEQGNAIFTGYDENATSMIDDLLHKHSNPIIFDMDGYLRTPVERDSTDPHTYFNICLQDLEDEYRADIESRLCYDPSTRKCAPWHLGDDFVPMRITTSENAVTALCEKEGKKFVPVPTLFPYQLCLFCIKGQLCITSSLRLPCNCFPSCVVDGRCVVHHTKPIITLHRGPGISHIYADPPDGCFGSISQYFHLGHHINTILDKAPHLGVVLVAPPKDLFRIVQGPPGTGKTIHIVQRLMALHEGVNYEENGSRASIASASRTASSAPALQPLPDTEVGESDQSSSEQDVAQEEQAVNDEDDDDDDDDDEDEDDDEDDDDAGESQTEKQEVFKKASGNTATLIAAVTNQAVSVCLAKYIHQLGYAPPQGITEDGEEEEDGEGCELGPREDDGFSKGQPTSHVQTNDFGLGNFSLSESEDASEELPARLDTQRPKIVAAKTNILVIGSPDNPRLRPICKPFTLHAQAAQDEAVMELRQEVLDRQEAGLPVPKSTLDIYAKTWFQAIRHVLQKSDVIFTTLSQAPRIHLPHWQEYLSPRIRTILLDEAGLIPEWHMPVFVGLENVETIEAVGDHKQLEPFSKLVNWRSCSIPAPESFFMRVMRSYPSRTRTLCMQYRMHPNICKVVSHLAYGGQLQTHGSVHIRNAQAPPYIKALQGVNWVDHREEEQHPEGLRIGWTNPQEVDLIEELVRSLVVDHNMLDDGKKLCILTFYKGQFELLNTMLLEKFGEAYYTPDDPKCLLQLATVDSMQGDEGDVILLSLVRSNAKATVGFVKNVNRMNVAISRAKEALVVVGDQSMFALHPLMDAWREAGQPTEPKTVAELKERMDEYVKIDAAEAALQVPSRISSDNFI